VPVTVGVATVGTPGAKRTSFTWQSTLSAPATAVTLNELDELATPVVVVYEFVVTDVENVPFS
jgi:hypothetical protein